MADKETKIQWKVNVEGQDNLSKTFNTVQTSGDKLKSTITALSTAYLAVTQIISQAISVYKEMTESFMEGERAFQRLSRTLKAMGNNSQESFENLKKFSLVMEDIIGIEKEATLELLSYNTALGMNERQAKQATTIAAGLSRAFGIDMATANQQLGMTLTGNVGRLSKFAPELRKLTEEQLQSGAAYDVIGQKIEKFLTSENSPAEVAKKIQIATDNIKESFGQGLFDAKGQKDMLALLRALETSGFAENLGKQTKAAFNVIKAMLTDMIRGFTFTFDFLANLIMGMFNTLKGHINSLLGGVTSIFSDKMSKEFFATAQSAYQDANRNSDDFLNLFNSQQTKDSLDAWGEWSKQLETTVDSSKKISTEIKKIREELDKPGAIKLDSKKMDMKGSGLDASQLKTMRQQYKDFIDSFNNDDYEKFRNTLDKKMLDMVESYRRGAITQQEYILAGYNYQKALDEKRMELNANQATTWVNAVQGGVSSIVSTLGSMFDKIAPGVGTLFATVINFLNKTKEEMRSFINGIIDQILSLPENIAASIPTIIETVINRIPEILERLIVSLNVMMPKIVINSVTAAIQGLANILPRLMNVQFWTGIARNLFTSLMDVFKNFFQALFFGSSDTITTAVSAAQKALFNTNADAGTNKFQLKDLAAERTEATLNQGIDAVITKGQKGLFQMLYDGIAGIFNQLWSGFINAFSSLASYFYNFGNYIWYGFVQYIGNFFYDLGKQIWKGLSDSITAIGGSVGGIFGGGGIGGIIGGIGGSIGGAIGSIGGSFGGWAEGGLVGGSAPYAGNATGNDIIPAMLSPGEFVVNRQQMANKDLSGVANAMGVSTGGSISLTINIASGASITENQLKQNFVPIIISELKKASSNGAQIISKRGVY